MSRFLRRNASQASTALDGDAAQAKTTLIHTRPMPHAKPDARPELSASQQKTIEAIRNHLLELHEELAQDDDYKSWEKRWIDDESTSRRYAVACKYDEALAKRRVADTLHWRREYKPELIKPEEVAVEGETGKHVLSGFDNQGRPVLYLRPGRENTKASPRQIRYLVWGLERALDFCPPGQEKICLLIDYASASQANTPSFSTSRGVLNILQNHYVERLGQALIVNVNWFVSAFFTAITPFLDPITAKKIVMLRHPPGLQDYIDVEQLDGEFGGKWDYRFEFEDFWSQVLAFTGVAQDGTRSHETKARLSITDEERTEAAKQVNAAGGRPSKGKSEQNTAPSTAPPTSETTPATSVTGSGHAEENEQKA